MTTPTPKAPITELVDDPKSRRPWTPWLILALAVVGAIVVLR